MRNPGGYLVIDDPDPWRSKGEQARREYDTVTCKHCNGIVKISPQVDTVVCKKCMSFICSGCHAKGGCLPFEEKLRAFERQIQEGIDRGIRLKSYGC